MLGPAGSLIRIESSIDYSGDELIFSIHCTKTNEKQVTITTIGGSKETFEPKSFCVGAVYHIFIKMIEFEVGTAGFIGYRLLKTDKKY